MKNRLVVIGLVALALLALPAYVPSFMVTLANYIGIYSLVALGLVLLTGVAGMTSFGQAAFMGVGAYSTAVLTASFGLSPWLGLVAAIVVTGLGHVNTNSDRGDLVGQSRAWRLRPHNSPPLSTACPGSVATSA